MEALRYVVLNPVRAGLVPVPEQYAWSSYRATLGIEKAPAWLEIGWTLRQFEVEDSSQAVASYRRFVLSGVGQDLPIGIQLKQQSVIGDETFRKGMQAKIHKNSLEHPRRELRPHRLSMATIIAAASAVFDTSESRIVTRGRDPARLAVALVAREETFLNLREIGEWLSLRETGTYHLIKRARQRIGRDSAFRKQIGGLRELASTLQTEDLTPSGDCRLKT
jgi:hypothetical protein